MAKRTKNEIKYDVTLDEGQKLVKGDIYANQIVVVIGRAGSGKSLVCANTAIDLLYQGEVSKIYVTRANIETGRSLGYLPGSIDEKFNPYLEAFKENVYKCYSNQPEKREKVDELFRKKTIDAMPIAFIRGKTIDDILVIEETQNLTPHEVQSIVTRLGKNGRIVFNGDFDQCDLRPNIETGERLQTGLHYLSEMSKAIPEIKWHHLESNHRSDLVGKILDWEYSRKKKND